MKIRMTKARSVVAGVAVLGVTAAVVPLFTADAATTAPAGVQIKVGSNNKCLNVSGASKSNNAKIIQYTCSASAVNDKFVLIPTGKDRYQVKNVNSGKCLNVSGDSIANNAKIVQYTCTTAYNSTWYVDAVPGKPVVQLVGVGSLKCLNVPNNSTANSVQLVQYTCKDSYTNDKFYLPPTTSATPVARALTTKQPVAAYQAPGGTSQRQKPITFSWIDDESHELVFVTENDLDGNDPNEPGGEVWQWPFNKFTGRPYLTGSTSGNPLIVARDAADGDAVLSEIIDPVEGIVGGGDIGGALASQPTIATVNPGWETTFSVIGGALWYAPQIYETSQPPVGAWRSLGGSGLTGTPAVVQTRDGARVFVRNTSGQMLTATLNGTTLSDWVNLGGTGLTGNPSATAVTGYYSLVFSAGSDGTIVYKKQNTDGSFPSAWATISGSAEDGSAVKIIGSPSVARDELADKVVVTARDAAGTVYVAYETAQGKGLFSDLVAYNDPSRAAGSDPTVFSYLDTTAGGKSGFGLIFMNTDKENSFPIYYLQDTRSGLKNGLAKAKPEVHELDGPAKKVKVAPAHR